MASETIDQYWNIKVFNNNPTFPFVVIDNWYTPNEEKAVWKELEFYSAMPRESILRAEDTIVARDPDGTSRSKAYRFYLHDIYKQIHTSHIINCQYKQQSIEFHKILGDNCMPYARSFMSSNIDNTQISYYENKDHYRPHHDTTLWTNLIWMVKEPRKFEGGDFQFNEIETTVKLKNNRAIFFPSCFLHSVTPIVFNNKPKEMGWGRYCITHFYFSKPSDF